jgi:pteridine reductase
MPKLISPTALITGAAHRIGKALTLMLHNNGFNVAIHYHQSQKEALHLASELNQKRPESAQAFYANLINHSSLIELSENVINWQPKLTVLINNASLFMNDEQANLQWQVLFSCNVKAPYQLSEACFPALKANNGCIINITDIHAQSPLKDYDIYCMTKSALALQTKSLAKRYAPSVRVNAIAPGAILWPENDNELSDESKQKIINNTLLNKTGGTTPITQAAELFINNHFVTGASLNVDGGRSLHG